LEWLPVAVAAICALLSIPLSRILKINYWLLILTALSALLVTFAFPYFFEISKSLKELFVNILFAGGALLLLLFAVAFIMLRTPKLTARQAQVQEEGAAINTDSPAPSRYIAFRNALLTKEGPPDEVLFHAAYMREQALDPEPILTARSAAHKSTKKAEKPEVIAADSGHEAQAEVEAPEIIAAYSEPEAQAEVEAPEIIAACSEPEVQEEAEAEAPEVIAADLESEAQEEEAPEVIAAHSAPQVQAKAETPEVIAVDSESEAQAEAEAPEVIAVDLESEAQEEEAPEVIAVDSESEAQAEAEVITAPLEIEVEKADSGKEPALMDLLDHAYTAMEAEDWQTACTAFKTALPLASEPYYIQRIKLELLNMLMRTGRKREAVDLVFDILGADYALSSAETATLFNVLQDLQKGA